MTISPSCSSSGHDNFYATSACHDSFGMAGGVGVGGLTGSGGSGQSRDTCPINVKPDHFYTGGGVGEQGRPRGTSRILFKYRIIAGGKYGRVRPDWPGASSER